MAAIVIHSRTKERISGTYCMEWSLHTAHRAGGKLVMKSKIIDKQKAREIIESRGLVVAHRTKDGQIYDTPQGDFNALFPNGICTKEDLTEIEKADKI